MIKQTLAVLTLTFAGTAMAACPPLEMVIPQLETIAERLKTESSTPVEIGGVMHTVEYGETSKAVDDILAGHFKGHSIHRLQETEKGRCEYRLTDDNTPAMGSFYLVYGAQ